MTVATDNTFNIKKIGIIGGGVAGISSLYELLHTSANGESTINDKEPSNPAFQEITLFERNDQLGGNWHYNNQSDPSFLSQELLDSGDYNEPDVVDPITKVPDDKLLKTIEDPYITNHVESVRWSNSAAYPGLFSNIIAPLVRLPNALKYYNHELHKDREIHPFSTATEIKTDILKFVNDNDLTRHIRFNTTVERIRKIGDIWELVLRKHDILLGKDEWYKEHFDSVIIANGHYSVPFVPYIENLNHYNKAHVDAVWHTKSIKEFTKFYDQDVLIVGSHASSADIIKYLVGNAKSITVSRRSFAGDQDQKKSGIHELFEQPEIVIRPKIEKFVDDSVQFIDGTVGSYDKIIFATGYHFHHPFLEDKSLIKLGKIVDSNSKYSLVQNLYLYSFSVKDPTLATIGIQQSPYLWATMESQSAAIAGVWSNHSKLPPKSEQIDWLNKRNEAGVFHIYNIDTAKSDLADLAVELAPTGRIHPFEVVNIDKETVQTGWQHTMRIYELFKKKELTFDKIREINNINV